MRRKRIFRLCCWRLGCGACHCVNLLLAFVAILQTGLILLNSLQREVPIPEGLTRWAVHRLIGDPLRAGWERAVFDLRGGLYLDNFILSESESHETLLTADRVHVDLALLYLISGLSPAIEELDANGIEVFIPASMSPSGLNEPVLEVEQLRLLESDDQLLIKRLILRSGGLLVYLKGSASLSSLQTSPVKSNQPMQVVIDYLKKLRALPPDLDAFSQIEWTLDETGRHSISLHTYASQFNNEMGSARNLKIQAAADIVEGQIAIRKISIDGEISSIPENWIPEAANLLPLSFPLRFSLSGSGYPASVGPFRLPGNFLLAILRPFGAALPVNTAILSTSLLEETPTAEWILSGRDFFSSGTLHRLPQDPNPDPTAASPSLSTSFTLTLNHPELSTFFPSLPDHRLLKNVQAGYLRLHATTVPGQRAINGFMVTDNLFIGQTDFSHIAAKVFLSPSDLALTNVDIRKSETEAASGLYFHHFPSSRFSLNATGAIFPSSLDTILGPWWKDIFDHIQAGKTLPADVTVWGLWNQPKSLNSMTAAAGEGVSYRGVAVPQMEIRIRSNHAWTYMEHLRAKFDQGMVEGKIGWQQLDSDEIRRPMTLDFRSTAPWEVVQAAAGVPELEAIKLTGSPEVEAVGIVWRPPRSLAAEQVELVPDLRIALQHRSEKCSVSGLELGGLSFSGTLKETQLNLDQLSGTFAEGVFTGRMRVTNWNDSELERTRLQIQLFDANYGKALTELTRLLDNPDAVRTALERDSSGGRLDSDLDLTIGKTLAQSKGSGRLTLRNAPIGQIHLLGGLSRILDSLGLGFSTLDLNSGSIQWTLANSNLEVPQCVLTGPVLSLQVSGSVDLVERNLNLHAELALFQGLMSKLLTPVSDNFQLDLTGPLENPLWKIRLNPFRWFQNRLQFEPASSSK